MTSQEKFTGIRTMQIGQFAQLTGLSVRTLRWYDAGGILLPAHVDPDSRYRRYSSSQIDDAITIRTLRDAGIALGTVLRVLDHTDPTDAASTLAQAHVDVIERRAREDAALERAHHAIQLRDQSWEIVDRTEPARGFVALPAVVLVPETDDEQGLAEINQRIGQLMMRMQAVGPMNTGSGWLSFGPGTDEQTLTVIIGWPVDGPSLELVRSLGDGARAGHLPARRELSLDRRVTVDEPDMLFDPGLLALIREADRRGLLPDLDGIRQFFPVPIAGDGQGELDAHLVRIALPVS